MLVHRQRSAFCSGLKVSYTSSLRSLYTVCVCVCVCVCVYSVCVYSVCVHTCIYIACWYCSRRRRQKYLYGKTGDRTRTLVSWSRRHIPTPPQSRTPLSTSDVLQVHGECTSSPLVQTLVKSRRTYRYWYSSPWNPDTLHGIGEGRENSGPHKSDLGRWGPSVWRYHLIDMYFSNYTWKW